MWKYLQAKYIFSEISAYAWKCLPQPLHHSYVCITYHSSAEVNFTFQAPKPLPGILMGGFCEYAGRKRREGKRSLFFHTACIKSVSGFRPYSLFISKGRECNHKVNSGRQMVRVCHSQCWTVSQLKVLNHRNFLIREPLSNVQPLAW